MTQQECDAAHEAYMAQRAADAASVEAARAAARAERDAKFSATKFSQMPRRQRLSIELASARRSYSDDNANGGNGSVLDDASRTNHWSR